MGVFPKSSCKTWTNLRGRYLVSTFPPPSPLPYQRSPPSTLTPIYPSIYPPFTPPLSILHLPPPTLHPPTYPSFAPLPILHSPPYLPSIHPHSRLYLHLPFTLLPTLHSPPFLPSIQPTQSPIISIGTINNRTGFRKSSRATPDHRHYSREYSERITIVN